MAKARFPPSSCRDGSVVWVTAGGGEASELGHGPEPWASPLWGQASGPQPLLCPPDSARPGSPPASSLTFQFSVVLELLIGHCRERRGRGWGLSQGGKEAEWRAGSPVGLGWTAWISLPSAQPKPYPSLGGGGGGGVKAGPSFSSCRSLRVPGF